MTWNGILQAHPLHNDRAAKGISNNSCKVENFAINKRFGPIIHMKAIDTRLIVVELPWEDILEKKPQPLAVHKYRS